jgi:hypothetical protein
MAAHGHGGEAPPPIKRDFDATQAVRALVKENAWRADAMSVSLVPAGLVNQEGTPLPIQGEGVRATVGRITLTAR